MACRLLLSLLVGRIALCVYSSVAHVLGARLSVCAFLLEILAWCVRLVSCLPVGGVGACLSCECVCDS